MKPSLRLVTWRDDFPYGEPGSGGPARERRYQGIQNRLQSRRPFDKTLGRPRGLSFSKRRMRRAGIRADCAGRSGDRGGRAARRS
jgi:hypothetical protein